MRASIEYTVKTLTWSQGFNTFLLNINEHNFVMVIDFKMSIIFGISDKYHVKTCKNDLIILLFYIFYALLSMKRVLWPWDMIVLMAMFISVFVVVQVILLILSCTG